MDWTKPRKFQAVKKKPLAKPFQKGLPIDFPPQKCIVCEVHNQRKMRFRFQTEPLPEAEYG
jgi:hypothetical protein